MSSVALALAVCQERDRELGDIVGYRIGGDYYNASKKGGSITYCTTELLANELERAEEDLPHNVSHIVVDEVHERSGDMDRLLSTIKLAFSQRLSQGKRVPKLVLMSATVESDLFEKYFEMVSQDGIAVRPPYLNVPGRVYKTEMKFLEAFEDQLPSGFYQATKSLVEQQKAHLSEPFSPPLEKEIPAVQWESAGQISRKPTGTHNSINAVAATIAHIVETTQSGAILAFVPGASEIRLVHQTLLKQERFDFGNEKKFEILMLHRYNPAHLVKALDTVADGVRRILISTNIAETSITFPDIKYVVDSGLQRATTDISAGPVQVLRDERISRASVLQRAGRAGRTKPGHYYGTFTTDEMRNLDVFANAQDSTQDRIQNAYLRAKVHFPAVAVQEVFDSYLTPIPAKKVEAAEQYLKAIGALTASGEVSRIGYALYRTTLTPAFARMVLLGIQFGCLDRAVILATLMSMKFSIFDEVKFDDSKPSDRKKAPQRFSMDSRSDLIAQLRAVEEFQAFNAQDSAGAQEWAVEQGIAHHHFNHIQSRIEAVRRSLYRAGFLRSQRAMSNLNTSSENLTILKMIICAGSYPNVASHQRGYSFLTHQNLFVRPSPSSIALPGDHLNPDSREAIKKQLSGSVFCYRYIFASKSGSKRYYMGDLTPITPLMLALFSPNVKATPGKPNQVLIDDSIPLQFSGDVNAASTFLRFKEVFDTALLKGLQGIAEMWGSDKKKVFAKGFTDLVLGAVKEVLEYEEGQATRREGDVGRFGLGPEVVEKWAANGGAMSWNPVDAPLEEASNVAEVPRDNAVRHDGLAPWDSTVEEAELRAEWMPSFDPSGDDGLSDLPGDMDSR
jgi:HrpA-like RNA helicase